MDSMDQHLYLIDGSGFIFRAFHALPPMTRPDGTPVNAVLGFSNMLYKLLEETPDVGYLAVIFDSARRNFRHEIFPAYKAHRPELPPELIPQFAIIREACRAFQVLCMDKEGYEADDLIASYARMAREKGMRVTIVSSDKDLMQLVGEKVDMLDPLKNRTIGPAEVFEKFGVPPEKVIDVQALAGDSSDGIPGVPGIGVKTAAELINTYGSLENLLARCLEIKQPKRRQVLEENKDNARLSHQLVTLKQDVPADYALESFKRQPIEPEIIRHFLQEQSFRALLARVEKKHGRSAVVPSSHTDSQPALQPVARDASYELVQSHAALDNWINKIKKSGIVAVDTETTSLNTFEAELVGISLAVQTHEACYIPLQHKIREMQLFQTSPSLIAAQLPLEEVLEKLRPILADPAILKVGHHLKYDMAVLQKYNVSIAPFADTLVMSYDLDGSKNTHGMDALAEQHLAYQTIRYAEVTGSGRQQITFDFVDLEKACNYAAEDADITLRLFNLFHKRLVEEHVMTVYETIDRPLIPVLLAMETEGIKINVATLKDFSVDLAKRLLVLEKEIYAFAGCTFNVGSPKQLGDILFQNLKIPGGKKSKTGAYATGISVLEDLAVAGHEIAVKIIEWRQLSKLKSTYTDALPQQINAQTGRLHTSYSMTITSTGRLSSSNPNLQNIPIRTEEGRKIRRAFIPEKGHKLVSLDYSQIELRLLAHMADIETLKSAFREGRDIHTATASEVFGIPLEQVDHEHRRRAKAINFGIIYGMSAFGLAQQLKIDRSTAAQYIKSYSERYPGIIAYMETLKEDARRQGYVTTLFGRKCFIPGIHDKNAAVRNGAERQAINAPLQGTAADIIKKAMIAMPQKLMDHHLSSKMLLQVHDELVFEVPESEIDQLIIVAKSAMEKVIHLKVPLIVEAGVGANWDEAH